MEQGLWYGLQNGSDIRGIALEGVAGESVNLTSEQANAIGQAFARWLSDTLEKPFSQLKIGVGRDSRLSGPMLARGLAEGLMAIGVEVSDFGLASTPAMFMSTVSDQQDEIGPYDGAVMITASHLPFNRNGFKFFTAKGGLDKQDIRSLLNLAAECVYLPCTQTAQSVDFMAVYAAGLVETVRQAIDHPTHYAQPLTGLKIIVDAGNGAGGFYVDRVLRPLGADTTGSQFLEPDGRFPNHIPNPEDAAAMASIRDAVIRYQADFGIIFDTDVDRSAAVDESGHEFNRNRLIALISAILLKQYPGATIVTDSVTSDGLTDFIENQLKGRHHRFKRGYKNVINEAIRLNNEGVFTPLAIETSGHAALKENYFLDDGAYLVTKLLVELAKAKLNQQSLASLVSSLNEPIEALEKRYLIQQSDFQTYGKNVLAALEKFVAEQDDWQLAPNSFEGIRVSCQGLDQQGWFLLRLSLHDPVLALNIEADVKGGVDSIFTRLSGFLAGFDSLQQR
ncbi:phosphomannomutase/phosphoglucomutase [Thiomicrospira microaerophila]|uniref:phosphomannomutase/phosphoglucomutase n=1 Tax=Thiomicrospira microaerophila TaxID=406020 RepID=UPI00200E4FF3|nr:phosphomannomutase/phosphoglucomutase [Thiomicrospira microaerophila]UQB43017.1 phosphomannomutase/phosphoglucomutase [Thiomicrospira microaerophila]